LQEIRKSKIVLIIFVLLFFCNSKFSSASSGFIQSYFPQQYQAHNNNTDICQDSLGNIYLANRLGVLKYNGINFTLIFTKNQSPVNSLCYYKGKIYVGATGEAGYIETNRLGKTTYTNLSGEFPKRKQYFKEFWSTIEINGSIYFCSHDIIFVLRGNRLSFIEPEEGKKFHKFFKINKQLFVRENNTGLKKLVGNELMFVKNSEFFADKKIDFIEEKNDKFIIGTRSSGFFSLPKLKGKKVEELNWEISQIAKNKILYCYNYLENGNIVFGTQQAGIYIADSLGKIIKHIDISDNLSDDNVQSIFLDKNKNLWIATLNGFSIIEVNSNLQLFEKKEKLPSNINNLIKIKENILLATDRGLYLGEKKNNEYTFSPFALGGTTCFDILEIPNSNKEFLVATSTGLMLLKDGLTSLILPSKTSVLKVSKYNPKIVYCGGEGFFHVIDFTKKNSEDSSLPFISQNYINENIQLIKNIDVRSIAEKTSDEVYFSIPYEGVFKLKNSLTTNASLEKLKINIPKLESPEFCLEIFSNKLLIGTDIGVYEVQENADLNLVLKKINFGKNINNGNSDIYIYRILNVQDSLLYIASDYNSKFKLFSANFSSNESIKTNESDFLRLDLFQKNNLYHNASEKEFWISLNGGLAKIDLSKKFIPESYFTTQFYKITLNNSELVFGNDFENKYINSVGNYLQSSQLEIPFSKNNIQFYFAATSFASPLDLFFSVKLEGFENSFSEWDSKSFREFSNLPEGDYKFIVRVKNIYNKMGTPTQIKFSVLPPWYRTIWAYTLYVVLGISFVWLLVRINTNRLKQKNIQLEEKVQQRTYEIEIKNKELIKSKEEIQHRNREITDSINYAKVIQNSILPSEDLIKEFFNQNVFIFFKPRDVVSGDFFWFNQNQDTCYLAVADCTGHGVPGAFMSMLGLEKLNQASKDSSKSNVSDILSDINIGIKKSLGQDQKTQKSKDGLEIVLCEINLSLKKLEYAGANRPLWMFRKNENSEIENIIYKPTKAGIAGNTESNQRFYGNIIELQANDEIFLFSDGAPDQFGGDKGKKLMTVGLKDLFKQINGMSSMEQKKYLDEFYSNWMKSDTYDYEQVDDILIIGIRIV
jgi:serine phosphatase RsbU (regulator of sigma subunit)/ligand-binding sensor domain-containing protein